ncbi:transposase, partial [Riemerella anatipestifer]
MKSSKNQYYLKCTTSFYGYKLHAVCSLNGVIKNFDISPASVHDIHYLKDIG